MNRLTLEKDGTGQALDDGDQNESRERGDVDAAAAEVAGAGVDDEEALPHDTETPPTMGSRLSPDLGRKSLRGSRRSLISSSM